MKHITLDEYEVMLNNHDWFYSYSDDFMKRKKGETNEQNLLAIAEVQGDDFLNLYMEYVKEKHSV